MMSLTCLSGTVTSLASANSVTTVCWIVFVSANRLQTVSWDSPSGAGPPQGC